jgi:hypothetical protein
MIDFIRDPVEICPNCFYVLDLDPDYPDMVVWNCPNCGKYYSPTDLDRVVAKQKAELAPRGGNRIGFGLFLFIIILTFIWLFS